MTSENYVMITKGAYDSWKKSLENIAKNPENSKFPFIVIPNELRTSVIPHIQDERYHRCNAVDAQSYIDTIDARVLKIPFFNKKINFPLVAIEEKNVRIFRKGKALIREYS